MKKFLAVIMMVLGLGMTACDAKVTDPADPRFDPEQFRFEDYKDHEALVPVLRHMFPIGTDRAYVDHILGERAGAKVVTRDYIKDKEDGIGLADARAEDQVKNLDAKTYVIYHGPGGFKFAFLVVGFYDKNDNLLQMISDYFVIHPTLPKPQTGE